MPPFSSRPPFAPEANAPVHAGAVEAHKHAVVHRSPLGAALLAVSARPVAPSLPRGADPVPAVAHCERSPREKPPGVRSGAAMGRGGYAGLAVVPALAVALGALVYAWPGSVEGARTAAQSVAGAAGQPAGKRTNDPIEVVSWEPRAFVWRSFLSEKECEHIKKVAGPHLARSKVVDSKNGGETVDPIRTSNGTFIRRRSDSIISTIEDRVARFTHLPVANQEDLQVLSYGASDQYRDHMDTLGSRNDPVAGERTMSVLMYLADVKSGGETVFPKSAKWADPSSAPSPESLSSVRREILCFRLLLPNPCDVADPGLLCSSQCARRGVAIKPRKGDALLFHDLTPNNEADPLSMHASCPVIDGLKWTGACVHSKVLPIGLLLRYGYM